MNYKKDRTVTKWYLDRVMDNYSAYGYQKPKWIEFCEVMLQRGYDVHLHEAQTTVSKYVTVSHENKKFLVRFSNHKPNLTREMNKDCDFFVGVNHLGVWTTAQAIKATIKFMQK